jgi:hypothetical protein
VNSIIRAIVTKRHGFMPTLSLPVSMRFTLWEKHPASLTIIRISMEAYGMFRATAIVKEEAVMFVQNDHHLTIRQGELTIREA